MSEKPDYSKYINAKFPFEEFLKDLHARDYAGLDDDMSDDFENWLAELDVDSLVKYGDMLTKALIENQKSIIQDKVQNYFHDQIKRVDIGDELSKSIVSLIVGISSEVMDLINK